MVGARADRRDDRVGEAAGVYGYGVGEDAGGKGERGGVWPVELEKGFRENKILRISMFKDKKRY